ncbi:cilia- and flagella-associated protein 74-like [Xylocopa sonorina]|uniref:cilia- and flagella-associated protein 74-like n=1 Tax=Xylocopa sonorina TaxID=1818115 RepID=UPI00403B1916
MYRIEVPTKFKCNLNVSFRPRYVGLHHEIMEVYFLTDNRVFGKQNVPIWAEVTGYQIQLDPPCVDLGIVMIDSDVCQQIFNVINTGSSTVEVIIKTPGCLRRQISVYPKSTVLQPGIPRKITVRLMPESSIVANAKRYYNPSLNMLEFPIQVEILSQEPEKPPASIAKILASLTACHGLIIEPTNIDLGHVYTHESISTELTLTNQSLLTQKYAFPLLPSSMDIHPNHGVGAILPGETIRLHLIYSPCLTDIPGNEIGANGFSGAQSFLVRVATLAELAGRKKRMELKKLKDYLNAQSTNRRRNYTTCGFPSVMSVNLKTAEFKRQMNDREENDSENVTYNDDSVAKENKLDYCDRKNGRNVTKVNACIVDTLCELSEQIIELPATPCGSFAMASIHLKGINMASYPHCTCGIVKYQNKEFTAGFEFQSSSDTVNIVPQSGTLNNNERVDVNFLFQPKLPESAIFEGDLRLKMNVEEQEMKPDRDYQSPKKEKKLNKKVAVDKKEEVLDVDKLTGENNLLETFEPCVSNILITCTINMEVKNGLKRNERLFAKLICPITRPEVLLLNEDREIVFGRTAIGTSARKFLFVKNISNRSVKVEVNLLNPSGPFFVPSGKTIEIGSVLKLPVTYKPTQENEEGDEEHFDVFNPRTRTTWNVRISGRGVIPSYVLKPRFRVARFEVVDEKSVELKISKCFPSCERFFKPTLPKHVKSTVYSEEITSCEQSKKKLIAAFHTLKQPNVLESVHRNLIGRAELCFRQDSQPTFSAITLRITLYMYICTYMLIHENGSYSLVKPVVKKYAFNYKFCKLENKLSTINISRTLNENYINGSMLLMKFRLPVKPI